MAFRLISMALAATTALAATAAPAVTIFTSGSTYGENFDSMATTSAAPAGWTFTGATTLTTGNGSSTAGGVYNFGTTGSTDRALGSLNTNSVLPVITATFTNGGSSTITALTVAYNGEVWRFGGSTSRNGAIDRLDFAYATGGAYTDVDALDLPGYSYTGTVAASALDGNVNRTSLIATLSNLAIAPGQDFTMRWTDFNVAGSDDGLAIDDFSLAATFADATGAVPEPASWAMMVVGFGLLGATMRRRRPAAVFG